MKFSQIESLNYLRKNYPIEVVRVAVFAHNFRQDILNRGGKGGELVVITDSNDLSPLQLRGALSDLGVRNDPCLAITAKRWSEGEEVTREVVAIAYERGYGKWLSKTIGDQRTSGGGKLGCIPIRVLLDNSDCKPPFSMGLGKMTHSEIFANYNHIQGWVNSGYYGRPFGASMYALLPDLRIELVKKIENFRVDNYSSF